MPGPSDIPRMHQLFVNTAPMPWGRAGYSHGNVLFLFLHCPDSAGVMAGICVI